MDRLIKKGGTLIDPSLGMNGPSDVAIENGTIREVGLSIDPGNAHRIVEAVDYIVTPGLIDIHTHVYAGINANGADPDEVGVYAGVTTLVDAGSTGCDNFAGFPSYVVPKSKTEIICFLHICRTGLATQPDIFSRESINLDATIRTVESNRDVIAGIKARMVSPALEIMGMEMPRLAKQAARDSGSSLMVHIGDTEQRYDPNVIRQLLPLMDEGDIITHLFTPNAGGVLDSNGRLVDEVKEARSQGIWLDTAHGRFNFSFDVGQRVLDQGLFPHCISTDVTAPGRSSMFLSLTEMMTRFMALGFSLEQVITMCTYNPAKALGQSHRIGSLSQGNQADVSILEVKAGDWLVRDSLGNSLTTDKAVIPVASVKRGELFKAHWGPRPGGWEPEHV